MAIRPTMANLIAEIRTMVGDTNISCQQFGDQEYQDTMDNTRLDVNYLQLAPYPTFSGSTIRYLDYYSDLSNWEDDLTLWQWRINQKIPSMSENGTGHWQFETSILPPVYLIGKTFDIYRNAADMLDRLSAKWATSYNMTVDGQSLQRGQVITNLQALAKSYRLKQRAGVIKTFRTDLSTQTAGPRLKASEIDYISSGG